MQHAARVRGLQRVGEVDAVIKERADLERPPSEALMECLALEQLHDEEAAIVVATHVEQRADVRVIERGNRARLAVEARLGLRVADASGGQDLHGDVPVETRVPGAIDLAHAARADSRENFVGAEARARRQGHVARLYGRKPTWRFRWPRCHG